VSPSRPSRLRQSITLTLFLLAFTSFLLAAPEEPGVVRGTVTDATGAVVAGARVRARNVSTGAGLEATAGAEGSYSLALPAGRYDIDFGEPGFQTVNRREWILLPAQPSRSTSSCRSNSKASR
jgi:Carboxypeptidase regulatory-like domain